MKNFLYTLIDSGLLIPLFLISLCAGIILIIWLLPFIHKHVDQLKIGSSEIKFRPFPPPETPSVQDLISEIKSWKESESTDEKLMSSIVDRFCEFRIDLYYSAMSTSLLITAMERPDVQTNLGKEKEKIMASVYLQLDYTIGKYFLLKKAIIALAKTVDKEESIQKKIENFDSADAKKSLLDAHKQIPEKHRKFDIKKFMKEEKGEKEAKAA